MTQQLMVVENDFMPALSVPLAIQRFNTMVQFVQNVMREGVDFGKVPGTDKPTLFKAGAEKLTTLFGLTVRFAVVEQVQDWTGEAHGGESFFYYWYRCQLWRGTLLIAEADGSCNSREGKYRWREAKRTCPACQQAAIIKGKAEYGGGWLCFKKQGGCGAKYGDGDSAIEGQPAGRVPNDDIASQVNTIQKMAQKRALVAAALIGCNASEFFTQDVEDVALVGDGAAYIPPMPLPPTPAADPVTGEVIDASLITKNGERSLVTRLRELVSEARELGLVVPAMPKPREMNDAQLMNEIEGLEARIAAKRAETKPMGVGGPVDLPF